MSERKLVLTEAQVLRMLSAAGTASQGMVVFEEVVGQQMLAAISFQLGLPGLALGEDEPRYVDVHDWGLEKNWYGGS